MVKVPVNEKSLVLPGLMYNLLIEGKELNPPGVIRRVDFLDLQGNVIASYPLAKMDRMESLYAVADIIPPEGFYYIRVIGVDSNGFEFQRITPTALENLTPGECLEAVISYHFISFSLISSGCEPRIP